MASASKKLLVVIRRSTFAGDEGRGCTEFKQATYPIKWRKYMCARCGALRAEHRAIKAKPDGTTEIREEEEHLPPRKRLMLRFERFQALAAAAAEQEKEKEEEELEEGQIILSADAMITKGKRGPRRKREDAP